MGIGYGDGPASEELLAEKGEAAPLVERRKAVLGCTEAEPARHFLGWLGEVDPDALFASGEAWGIVVVERALPVA